MIEHEVDFCVRLRPASISDLPVERLIAPMVDRLEGSILDPSLAKVVVRIAPYAGMNCGDRLVLHWEGLDIEGFAYQYELVRFVSQTQVGKEVVFVIKGMHVAALDGGSVQIYWTLESALAAKPAESVRLQLTVGDVRSHLLAPVVENSVTGSLEPSRVAEGTLVTMPPYARMAVGDRVVLSMHGYASPEVFTDSLKVEASAVGQSLSFWVPVAIIEAHRGGKLVVEYRVEQLYGTIRTSERAMVFIGSAVYPELGPPEVVGARDDVVSVKDCVEGVSIHIEDAQAQEGELVYLKCDGELFSHRDDHEITLDTAGQPLSFTVPYEFWREHQGKTVRIAYSVERLDDVSQQSSVRRIKVEA